MMLSKRARSTLLLVVALAPVFTAHIRGADTFENTVVGEQVLPGSSSFRIEGLSSGSVPGDYSLSLLTTGANVDGGTWYLVVRREVDGEPQQTGRLRGRITAGSIEDVNGSPGKVVLELTVDRGTGEFAAVTSGTGVVDGTFSAGQFSGTFTLTF